MTTAAKGTTASVYWRPAAIVGGVEARRLVEAGAARPLAGGPLAFTLVERMERTPDRRIARRFVDASDLPVAELTRLTAPRPHWAGLDCRQTRIMGILNVTPDSFSDGGRFVEIDRAVAHGRAMVEAGADIIDVGGESTRPGAEEIDAETEIARVVPVFAALKAAGCPRVSVDTRKAAVMQAALDAGADIVNDVSALSFDPRSLDTIAESTAPVVLMHAQGTPQTMQAAPTYDDVLLDVYDALAARIAACEAAGIPRDRLAVDPGIGFGKTVAHNLDLLRGLSLFHGLGCPLLIGVSRKSVVGALSGGAPVADRLPGSLALMLAAVAQGAQILRVHDVAESAAALAAQTGLWNGVKAP